MAQHSWKVWQQQLRSPLGNLVEIGEVRHSRSGMPRYRYLERYALVVITRGEGTYEDERGFSRSLCVGDWILVLPELGHSYKPWEVGGWDEIYVMFDGPVFDAWRANGLLAPEHVTGSLSNLEQWVADFHRGIVESSASNLEKICVFQSLLARALDGTIDLAIGKDGGPSWFGDACRMLGQPGADGREVAAALGLNYETFRRNFQKHAGQSPHRYHLRQLVNSAARMLDTTDLKAAEIARTLGFCDEAYFSRTFKKLTGRSPRTYRQTRGGPQEGLPPLRTT
ncbi:helix-turn-helix transcriptional regulator [Luteolibacter ambystomatis]|uniref:Helix-turn-helix transcriptional regulator n=1 Tax=Luteolibacter ambystomatis TaxID=2824561 RepID=A0A975IZ70_9BACT|nr:AraC family transcriptional regulator [Luteolibacter ambystomatis]QUE50608.1 helix-turn-helix transcriptional regulator [Luteolibacter ambystomatis]